MARAFRDVFAHEAIHFYSSLNSGHYTMNLRP